MCSNLTSGHDLLRNMSNIQEEWHLKVVSVLFITCDIFFTQNVCVSEEQGVARSVDC